MRFLIILLMVFSSCAMQSAYYTDKPISEPSATAAIPTGKAFEQQFLSRVNALRSTGCKCGNTFMPPAAPLRWNSQLEAAAFAHAADMSKSRYFSHSNLKGETLKQRIENAGYILRGTRAYSYGENIAAGQRSIERVMQSWINSPGHCKNLMNPAFKEIGVAQTNYYWVQDFGMREIYSSSLQE
jgi:uncharacterized protein YkwD